VTKFMINKDGATFYLNGNTLFRPVYGALATSFVQLDRARWRCEIQTPPSTLCTRQKSDYFVCTKPWDRTR
jgi:hypothetical protein